MPVGTGYNTLKSNAPIDKVSTGNVDGINETLETEKGGTEGKSKFASGIVDHLKEDFELTKNAMSNASDIVTGKRAAAQIGAAQTAVDATESLSQLKDTGGEYLKQMGRGNKFLGGAKIAGYMIGASMLADMLNPFDDDGGSSDKYSRQE
jgi:hypothetical protein